MLPMQKINQALDKLDKAIMEHSEHVGMMNLQFAKTLNLPVQEQNLLYVVGLCHELGKQYLNERTMEAYPIVSKILVNSFDNELAEVGEIVEQCMENVDGSGFPRELTAQDIHFYAIVTHISDFYDSMRMSGKTHDETTALIRKQTDIMFPKKIITPFIKMIITYEDIQFYPMPRKKTKKNE